MKTKPITLEIPAYFKYLAIQPWGEYLISSVKPYIIKDDCDYEYWNTQKDSPETCIDFQLDMKNINWKESLRKI
jgi:hypothetical protein